MASISIDLSNMKYESHRYKGISKKEFGDFRSLIEGIADGPNHREVLENMSLSQLQIIQRAQGLTHTIRVSELNDEALVNLLVSDKSNYVDLNNDGIVEIGNSKMFMFPPPNAPNSVKNAWASIEKNMTEEEKMLAQGMFLARQFEANCREDALGNYHIIGVGSPGYRSAFGQDLKSYNQILSEMINRYKETFGFPSVDRIALQWKIDTLTEFRNLLDNAIE